jgi:hypothetical protein
MEQTFSQRLAEAGAAWRAATAQGATAAAREQTLAAERARAMGALVFYRTVASLESAAAMPPCTARGA